MKIAAGSFVVRATEPVERAYLHSVIVLYSEPSMRPPPSRAVSIDRFFPHTDGKSGTAKNEEDKPKEVASTGALVNFSSRN